MAVGLTAGMGAYVKISGNRIEAPARAQTFAGAPKDIRVEMVRVGSGGFPAGTLVELGNQFVDAPSSAAWMSFRSFANGKQRIPSVADAFLTFRAVDDRGEIWAAQLARTQSENYVYLPGGCPLNPKKLWMECYMGPRRVGRWELPRLPKLKSRFSEADAVGDPNKDFPGLGLSVLVSKTAALHSALVRLDVAPDAASERHLVASIRGTGYESFGRRGALVPTGVLSVPEAYLEKVKAIEVEVRETRPETIEKTISIERGRFEQGQIAIEPVGPISLAPGVDLYLRAAKRGDTTTIRAEVKGPNSARYLVSVVSAEGVTGRSAEAVTAPREFQAFAPEGQTAFTPFLVKIQYGVNKTVRSKRYIMKLPRAVGMGTTVF